MYNFYKYKVIPQNYLAEEILLGIVLIYPEILHKTKKSIKTDFFFIESNRFIYSKFIQENNYNIIKLLYDVEKNNTSYPINYINNMIKLMKTSQVFISYYNTTNYIESIIRILKTTYIKRLFIQLGYNIINLGYTINIKNNYSYSKLISYIGNITQEIQNQEENKITNIKEFISEELIGIKFTKNESDFRSKQQKIKSGFINLDKIIEGFPASSLIIIAGRPSVGKTSISINIAYNCFFKEKINLLIFSLEMTSKQIFKKFVNIGSHIHLEQQKINTIHNDNWEKMSKICHKLLSQNIYINEETNLNINQIEFISNQLNKNQFIHLIIIDYLQLIELSYSQKIHNIRNQEISYITRRLKLLAQYLKIPIITISQLNRNIDNRENKEPILSDLKESGCIIHKNNIDIPLHNYNVKSLKKIEHKTTENFILNENEITILNQRIYQYNIKYSFIGLTSNHKFLFKNIWIPSHQATQNTKLIKYSLNNKKILKKIKAYLTNIKVKNLSKTYDIKIYKYFSFTINKIFIHNSIEQDADIIIILYEKEGLKYNIHIPENKIIDLKVLKNRNGSTGYCKLNFELFTNIFKEN
uniref:Replication helicase subunit n=1 Tax=Kapraunia schneideri TaxID=717899 RepID=A0A1Z1MTG2_9FLOR|nr:Replication helicase subunit [Kapraunia schneideri]ARW68994.1 Replication helicase subunit [Kapraunia schneideri]